MLYKIIQLKPKQKFHILDNDDGKFNCIKVRNKSYENPYKVIEIPEIIQYDESICNQCLNVFEDRQLKKEWKKEDEELKKKFYHQWVRS